MSGLVSRILVPLDGSKLAESVLPMTVLLARSLGATVQLLHIIEEAPPAKVHGEPHLTSGEAAEKYLEEVTARLGGDVSVEGHVHVTREHDVALSIAAHASKLNADMIALCTHGRQDLQRLMSGSIAQKVLQRVSAPVLLVRPGMAVPSEVRTVMTPLSGTPEAEAALPLTIEIARESGAMVKLVSVVATLRTLTGDDVATGRLTPIATIAALNAQEEQARAYLAAVIEYMGLEGATARGEVRRGDTGQMLAEAAAQMKPDLIVIATHARAGLGAYWIGSVAAGLVKKVSQPLLLVRIGEGVRAEG